jgi:hypothetical protein
MRHRYKEIIFQTIVFGQLALFCLINQPAVFAQESSDSVIPCLRPMLGSPSSTPERLIEPKNVPDFPQVPDVSLGNQPTSSNQGSDSTGTALKGEATSTTLPVQTRLRLVLETAVDSKTSRPGDIFEAHVRDDLFVGTSLLLAKGTLVRGRIAEVNKARIISRAAKIGLRLEQIVTPTGEIVPLDAALAFQKGVANQKGQLDPGTNFSTRVESGIRAVSGQSSTGAAKGALVMANIATLGAPTIATAIGGSAIALFRSGDNISLSPGQEMEVLLTNGLGLQIN